MKNKDVILLNKKFNEEQLQPKISDVINLMEKIAPPSLALPEDKIGLQLGKENTTVKSILISLDVTEEVIEEAVEKEANLIIAHHPIIYRSLQEINFSKYPSSIIRKAILSDISIYIAHTNLDIAPGGINDILSEILEVEKIKPLLPLRDNPEFGIGKIGTLKEGKTLREIAKVTEEKLKSSHIRVAGKLHRKIKRIAICSGSGKDLIYPACQKKAELFITGELGYHATLEAKSIGLCVIEAGHYETEVVVLPFLREKLEKEFKEKSWEGKIFQSKIYTNPYLPKNLSQVDL